jgi:hypothetical protein
MLSFFALASSSSQSYREKIAGNTNTRRLHYESVCSEGQLRQLGLELSDRVDLLLLRHGEGRRLTLPKLHSLDEATTKATEGGGRRGKGEDNAGRQR